MALEKIGYSLVDLSDNSEAQIFGSLPATVTIAAGTAYLDKAGLVIPDSANPTHKIVERWSDPAPSPQHTLATATPVYDGAQVNVTRTWTAPPPPTVAELLAHAAAKRYAVETGGVVLNGAPIATDRESKATITGAYVLAVQNPSYAIANWKVAPSTFITLDNATIIAIGTAVSGHVQACYDTEAALAAQINALTVTTTAEIDAAVWPSNS